MRALRPGVKSNLAGGAKLAKKNPQAQLFSAGGADGLVEDFEGNVNVLAREDERRRPAYRVVARAEDDQAAPVALHLDAVAKLRRGRVRRRVRDERFR